MTHKWLCKVYDNYDRSYFYLTNYDVLPYFRWTSDYDEYHPAIQFENYISAFNVLKLFYASNSSDRFQHLTVISPEGKSKELDFGFYQDLQNMGNWNRLNRELNFE